MVILIDPIRSQNTSRNDHPNVLFIAIDDLNDWVGCLGGNSDVKTPNMDKLASRGVLFTNAHCQSPLCGPSRASIMTGLRPSTTGIYGMINDNKIREDNSVTEDIIFLPEYFKFHDYYTMGIGKLFHRHVPEGLLDKSGGHKGIGPFPEKRFKWEGVIRSKTSTDWGAYPDDDSLMPDYESVEWAKEQLNNKYDKPFFLGVGFLRPHVPWYVPSKWFDLYDPANLVMPLYKSDDFKDVPYIAQVINNLTSYPTTEWAIQSGEWRNMVQAYLACISFVDHQVGKLLEALDNSPYADNTIIVLWSDHGYRLGEKGTFAKQCLWEEATRVPLIIAGPNIPSSKSIAEPVELLSLYPTLLELTNLPKYSKNQGESLVPLIDGKPSLRTRFAITTYGMNNHAIRTDKYRYIQYEDGSEELYDHKIDPYEWENLAKNHKYQRIKEEIKQHLPKENVPWTKNSSYWAPAYFKYQKERSDSIYSP